MAHSISHNDVDVFYSFCNGLLHKHAALQKHTAALGLSLSEAKILRSLAEHAVLNSSALCDKLQLDAGYVSRLLKGFENGGLIHKRASRTDRRNVDIVLAAKGKKLVAQLEAAAREEIGQWLAGISAPARLQMIGAMQLIEEGLQGHGLETPVVYRDPLPGEVSHTVMRQAMLLHEEQGWGAGFEALLNQVAHDFLSGFKPDREKAWMAEYGGEVVGSIYLAEKEPGMAQLRMLYVEPHVRGMGIGRELLNAAVAYAVEKQYLSVRIWTNSSLVAARAMYEKAGFVMIEETSDVDYASGTMLQAWAKGIL